ncbi:MAG: hypothetical protein OIN66_16300 [Candidatus Methanoperedens sp.]|nr:hypothetical protein [Candidatus Methanoperedens sp.]
MGLETLLPKILEGATSLDLALIGIVAYFIVREFNAFNDMKSKVHKYDSDIVILKRDIDELKKQLERLDNEHRSYTARKGGKHY